MASHTIAFELMTVVDQVEELDQVVDEHKTRFNVTKIKHLPPPSRQVISNLHLSLYHSIKRLKMWYRLQLDTGRINRLGEAVDGSVLEHGSTEDGPTEDDQTEDPADVLDQPPATDADFDAIDGGEAWRLMKVSSPSSYAEPS